MSYACPQVDVFKAGTQRGQQYSVADLDAMVRNFNQFCRGPNALMEVPAVLGHSEEQPELDKSGEPAAGWVKRLWREGTTLKADIGDIPAKFAADIKQKSYRTVSVEIYEEPPDGVPAQGMMVRRVALLGGEIPQVKGMKPLPDPVPMKFAEGPGRRFWLRQPAALIFSEEGRPMPNLQALIDALAKYGVSAEDAPKAIDELMPLMSGQAPADAPMADMPPDESAPAMPSREEMIAQLVAKGMNPDELQALSDQELYELLQPGAEQMADPTPSTPAVAPAVQRPAAPTNPGAVPSLPPKSVTLKYSEAELMSLLKPMVDAAVAKVEQRFAPIEQQTGQLMANTKRANIAAFTEAMAGEGRIPPKGHPERTRIEERLYRADATRAVSKFKEGGKEVAMTELDLQMQEIRERVPFVRFGEKGGMPAGGVATFAEDEKARVSKFYEDRAIQFRKTGVSKETFVAGWEAARKRDPEIRVESYCKG